MLKLDTAIYSFSRTYLECFTSQELFNVADQLQADLPDGMSNRTLIIEEILDAVSDRIKSREAAESGAGSPSESSANPSAGFPQNAEVREARPNGKEYPFQDVQIPEHYNITYIRAIVRDWQWVFVFWEIKESLVEKLVKMDGFGGLCLRLNTLIKGKIVCSYSIPVRSHDKAWYLDFPPEGERFFVEICARINGKEEALAKTRSMNHPKMFASQVDERVIAQSPLAVLSGLKDILVPHERNRGLAP